MKYTAYILLGLLCTQPSNADVVPPTPVLGVISALAVNQSYDYVSVGRDLAGVFWSSKDCLRTATNDSSTGSGIVDVSCFVTPNPDLFTPTVVIFNGKTGGIIKHIRFFDDTCPFTPVSLTGNRRIITLVARVERNFRLDVGGASSVEDSYPDCVYSRSGTTVLSETRSTRSGKLINNTQLQDIDTYTFE